MTAFSIRSAGYWLASVAPFGDLAVTWRFGDGGGGLAEVSWAMDLPYDYDHPALRNGALVELFDAGQRVGMAKLAEPGRTEAGRSFTAIGVYREAERFLCLDSDGQTTTIPNEAVDQAHARGCILTRGTNLTGNALVTGSVTEGLNYLSDLLDAFAIETSQFWFADGDARIWMWTPAAPMWQIVPGVVDPQPASDGWATKLFGRYQTAGTLHTATAADTAAEERWGGPREQGIDLTNLGSIDSARAGNRLAGLLARGRSKLSIADRLEVNRYQLQTMGGQPADLSMVHAGQVVRIHGLAAYSQWLDGNPWMDITLGEVTWADGADTITLAAVDKAPDSYEDLLAGTGAGGSGSGSGSGAALSGAGSAAINDTGWTNLTLGNSWTNTGSPYHNAAYRKIGNCVYLRGVITAGTYAATIATLPSGFRPTERLILSGGSAGITSGAQTSGTAHTHNVGPISTRFDIQSNGIITAHGNLASAYLSLDGVSFLIN